jgi:dTDP-4-amino-4,6-dideoxygalactose transaminase
MAVPVHQQPAYRTVGECCGSLANTEFAVERIVSLPVYPQLTGDEVGWITAALEIRKRPRI